MQCIDHDDDDRGMKAKSQVLLLDPLPVPSTTSLVICLIGRLLCSMYRRYRNRGLSIPKSTDEKGQLSQVTFGVVPTGTVAACQTCRVLTQAL